MSSSSETDEIVPILALVATESAKRETASQNISLSIGKAPNRERNFAEKMASIRDDYFVDDEDVRRDSGIGKRYTEEEFERRLRMPRSVFDEVFVVVSQDRYFRERNDATGKPGAFPIQKVVSALRQLCYGLSSDGVKEYTGLSESTLNEALKMFCNVLIPYLGEKHLRRPTAADLKHIESVYRSKGFPGCIECLDCAGWTWDRGPVAHRGFSKGRSKRSEIRMEVIYDESLWIWHPLFCCPGSYNAINVLNCSPLFSDVLAGSFPPAAPAVDIEGFKLG
jgi:Plant transposon protein